MFIVQHKVQRLQLYLLFTLHDYLFANTQFICYKITSFKKGIEIKIEYLRKYIKL